jgi:hypothetical protein
MAPGVSSRRAKDVGGEEVDEGLLIDSAPHLDSSCLGSRLRDDVDKSANTFAKNSNEAQSDGISRSARLKIIIECGETRFFRDFLHSKR